MLSEITRGEAVRGGKSEFYAQSKQDTNQTPWMAAISRRRILVRERWECRRE